MTDTSPKSPRTASGIQTGRSAPFIVSPYGLALVSTIIFLGAFIFPPQTYGSYMDEADLIFFDVRSLLFFGLCLGAFLAGVFVADMFLPGDSFLIRPIRPTVSPLTFLLAPLLFAIAMNMMSIFEVVRDGTLINLLLAGEGGALKEERTGSGSLVLTGTFLMGVLWWAMWRFRQLTLSKRQLFAARFAIVTAGISTVLSATIKLGRGELIPILLGSAVVYILIKSAAGEATHRFVVKFLLIFGAILLAGFFTFGFLRGTDDFDKAISDVIAYSLSSYNRMAALLSGRLTYPYGGRGLYISGFLSYNNLLNSMVPIRETFRWPGFFDVWDSEFASVASANLNPRSIWSGAMGYVFSDLGWLSPLLFLAYGLLYGVAWRSVKAGKVMGLVVYPWCAFCLLFWCGNNQLLDTKLIVLLLAGVSLVMFESITLRQQAPHFRPDALPNGVA